MYNQETTSPTRLLESANAWRGAHRGFLGDGLISHTHRYLRFLGLRGHHEVIILGLKSVCLAHDGQCKIQNPRAIEQLRPVLTSKISNLD